MINPSTSAGDEVRALTAEEVGVVAGGILPFYAAVRMFVSPLDTHALNPQPLPPGPSEAVVLF